MRTTKVLYVLFVRLDNLLQRMSLDVDKNAPQSKLEPSAFELQDVHQNLSDNDTHLDRQDLERQDYEWGGEGEWGRERGGGRHWGRGKREIGGGYGGRERGGGYGRRERGRWRRDDGWRERSQFPGESGRPTVVRLDSSTITAEQWNTPLPRNTRIEG